jgi:hypothetical protein
MEERLMGFLKYNTWALSFTAKGKRYNGTLAYFTVTGSTAMISVVNKRGKVTPVFVPVTHTTAQELIAAFA